MKKPMFLKEGAGKYKRVFIALALSATMVFTSAALPTLADDPAAVSDSGGVLPM